jgi:hypothetical protein
LIDTAQESLVEKICALAESLDDKELARYRLMLGVAAGGLAPHGNAPSDPEKLLAFKTILQCLARIQKTGIAYRGRPHFLTDDLLSRLQTECDQMRDIAEKADRYLLTSTGDVAHELARGAALNQFVNEVCPGLTPTGTSSYIYYEGKDAGLDPHIDSDSYSVNVILILDHSSPKSGSRLIIFRPDGTENRLQLEPGECVILYAGGTVHAREDLIEGESVRLLTIGFETRV